MTLANLPFVAFFLLEALPNTKSTTGLPRLMDRSGPISAEAVALGLEAQLDLRMERFSSTKPVRLSDQERTHHVAASPAPQN